MKSAAEMLLRKTQREIWTRGQTYASRNLVELVSSDSTRVRSSVKGTTAYSVSLRITGRTIRIDCDCPYFAKNGQVCKHIVATALVWDDQRGIPCPNQESVDQGTVPAPSLMRRDINALFRKPLEANLDHLRILADETALGGRGRSHSQLPKQPSIITDVEQPLTVKEMRKAYSELRRWSRRSAFDPYFCAGEMVAAFCEVLRIVRKHLDVTPPLVAGELLLGAQDFNRTLVTELIDDSQGLHVFSEAHLDDIYQYLQGLSTDDQKSDDLRQLLEQFRDGRGEY